MRRLGWIWCIFALEVISVFGSSALACEGHLDSSLVYESSGAWQSWVNNWSGLAVGEQCLKSRLEQRSKVGFRTLPVLRHRWGKKQMWTPPWLSAESSDQQQVYCLELLRKPGSSPPADFGITVPGKKGPTVIFKEALMCPCVGRSLWIRHPSSMVLLRTQTSNSRLLVMACYRPDLRLTFNFQMSSCASLKLANPS